MQQDLDTLLLRIYFLVSVIAVGTWAAARRGCVVSTGKEDSNKYTLLCRFSYKLSC